MNIKPKTQQLVLLAIFIAIILALGLPGSPLQFIGFPAFGPIRATTIHIPVILGAVLEGPLFGGILGLVMGLTSLLSAVMAPVASSPFFLRPETSVLPRIFIGLVAALLFRLLSKRINRSLAAGIAAAAGTATNTLLVVMMMTWRGPLGADGGAAWDAITAAFSTLISINGAFELVLAVVITVAVERGLRPMVQRRHAQIQAQRERTRT